MPKRKRGVRKFFKPPAKGHRHYGKDRVPGSQHLVIESDQFTSRSNAGSGVVGSSDAVEIPVILMEPRLSTNECDFLGWNEPSAISVLSLFDGISCGLVALKNLNIDIQEYFSSEIDPDALAVQKYHFYRELKQLGCVKSISAEKLDALPPINLLLGGSPCNNLSLVNPRRMGLHGEGSSGTLFFEFVRIRDHLLQKAQARGQIFYWLFENTTALEHQTLAEMTSALGCSPVMRCASEFVPMRRERNFWGNLPLMDVPKTALDGTPKLQRFLKPYREANTDCLRTVTSSTNSQRISCTGRLPVVEDGKDTLLYEPELEQLFGLDEHHTDVASLSPSRRRRLLGKAWCVPVIVDLLKPLVPLFKTV